MLRMRIFRPLTLTLCPSLSLSASYTLSLSLSFLHSSPVGRDWSFASDFVAYILLDTRVVHVNKMKWNKATSCHTRQLASQRYALCGASAVQQSHFAVAATFHTRNSKGLGREKSSVQCLDNPFTCALSLSPLSFSLFRSLLNKNRYASLINISNNLKTC